MNRLLLKKAGAMVLLAACTIGANAQVLQPLGFAGAGDGTSNNPYNFYADYVGTRFTVTTPSAVSGTKQYVAAEDWGGAVTSAANQSIVKADPYLGCASLTNAAAISGKWALIQRGDCEFGAKALAAQTAGAVGCIIVNNAPGGPVGMAAGASGGSVSIPVIMISDVDGAAIEAQLTGGTPVIFSITTWGASLAHDLGMVPNGAALWHAYAIPAYQLAADNGNPSAYKGIMGAFIANFGANSESTVELDNSVTFNPSEGGAPTSIFSGTSTFDDFPIADSVKAPYGALYDVHASAPGRFDVNYSVSADDVDLNPTDNSLSYSFYASDSIFSKGRYNFETGEPTVVSGYRLSTGAAFTWGPLYYAAKGGKYMDKLQFSVSSNEITGSFFGQSDVNLYVMKWDDGSAGQPLDSVMEAGELSIVGAATYTFTTEDSGFDIFTANVVDANSTTERVMLEDNAWYWVVCDVPATYFLACDGQLNYYPRTYYRYHQAGAAYREEYYAPLHADETGALIGGDATQGVAMIPFDNQTIDSTRFSHQLKGLVPAIAMHVSENPAPVSVKNVNASIFKNVTVFPNPATDILNVSVSLDKVSKRNSVIILDGMGRAIYRTTVASLQHDNLAIPIKGYAAGNYYVTVNTEFGTRVTPFVVLSK